MNWQPEASTFVLSILDKVVSRIDSKGYDKKDLYSYFGFIQDALTPSVKVPSPISFKSSENKYAYDRQGKAAICRRGV